MDLCGPMPVPSLGGTRYIATFVDDYSKYSVVRCVEHKYDIPDVVEDVLTALAARKRSAVRAVRTDRGTEYLNKHTDAFFKAHGIDHQPTAPYSPQSNGVAEALNRTLLESVRALLQQADLSPKLWAEAIHAANSLRNMCPADGISTTPAEAFDGTKPDVSTLRVFGSPVYAHVPAQQRNKLDPVTVKGIYLGHTPGMVLCRVLIGGKVFFRRFVDLTFDERAVMGLAPPLGEDAAADEPPRLETDSSSGGEDEPSGSRYPQRERRQPVRFSPAAAAPDIAARATAVAAVEEPATHQEAMRSPHAQQWREAMDAEMESLHANGTWELEQLPPGSKALPCKWVFKVKQHADGSIERFKARVVAKGFMQREGIDFNEVYAPTSRMCTMRTLLALAVANGWHIRHLDVKTAFLHGVLEETIYMHQPPGYVTDPKLVCHLRKSLYGLRQAPRAWYCKLKATLEGMGFTASTADPSLYTRQTAEGPVHLVVWVDDIIVFSPNAADEVVSALQSVFDVRDLGQATNVLGMQLVYDRTARTLHLSQPRLITELLERYSMTDAKPRSVPLSPATKLTRTEPGKELDTARFPYSALVGSLQYIAVCTRPDIAFTASMLGRHSANPGEEQWQAAKESLRYLVRTAQYGLRYHGSSEVVYGFCDADFAGDISTRRSTTAFVIMCNGAAISWQSRLQPTTAASTTEAEYMAANAATREMLWLRNLLYDLGMQPGSMQISSDSQGALGLMRNPVLSQQSKHIDVLYHFVRDRIALGQVHFSYVNTSDMLADLLTKALPAPKHAEHCANMGVCPP